MIQIWSLLQEIEDRYYLMDDFQIVSLYPPVKSSDLYDNTLDQTKLANSTKGPAMNSVSPPAGKFRFATRHESIQLLIKGDDNERGSIHHQGKQITRIDIPNSFDSEGKNLLLMREKSLSITGVENIVS